MSDLWILTGLLALLLFGAVMSYRTATQREAADAACTAEFAAGFAQLAAYNRRMQQLDRAMSDDRGACWICTAPVGVLELVDGGARVDLACLECAEVLKARKGATA